MLGIPPARDTDAEDVSWGLQTAEALWKRGERIDAIVSLRRAAQAAGEAADDDRALHPVEVRAGNGGHSEGHRERGGEGGEEAVDGDDCTRNEHARSKKWEMF